MKKIFLAAAFALAVSAAGTVGASAQMTGPSGQDSMRSERMMDSNARMGRHHRMHKMKMHKRHMMKRRMMMRGRM